MHPPEHPINAPAQLGSLLLLGALFCSGEQHAAQQRTTSDLKTVAFMSDSGASQLQGLAKAELP